MSDENRNLVIAIVVSMVILFGFQYLWSPAPQPVPAQAQVVAPQQQPGTMAVAAVPAPLSRDQALLTQPQRIKIETPRLHGSINLQGAVFDDLTLAEYHETTNPNSPEIKLLSPLNSKDGYAAEFTWTAQNAPGVVVPSSTTIWKADRTVLTPQTPVTLSWNNGQGLTFEQIISLDDQYMFTITQKVHNSTHAPITLAPEGHISRLDEPVSSGFMILHEGPIGVFDGKLNDPSYEDVSSAGILNNPQAPGWLGMTDKYWLTALIPDPKESITSSFTGNKNGTSKSLGASYVREAKTVGASASIEVTNHFFAGAKVLKVLDSYEETLGINHFDLAVDFGWFYFLTKPIFHVLTYLNALLGNFGLAILALTVLFKAALFPLANKSYRSMGRMKLLQPQIQKLQEQYKDDRMKLNEKMMELYKKEGANPVAGCLPMLVQIPIFFALYKVLFITIEMRHAPFYGWIHDLSAPDPTTFFNLFGLIPWTPPSFLMIGAWPLIMGATMLIQQKMSPPPGDPTQAKVMMLMPVIFTAMLAQFPAGLVIYWAWNNFLSMGQQWLIMKQASKVKPKAANKK
ncbi:Membrane protein insertase YidC [Candidatus Bealeia paramacronuclearis]|uniref:Membrane protein insertase YidC n=1 Tax=Candidatus Bealeia paramacronuclearis TaxID=1921001 RepID=A0ABZ2C3Z9_9PROT|nr:Membrane protein insertase YidC [Candidatus Bealeia paramacronuclearis]